MSDDLDEQLRQLQLEKLRAEIEQAKAPQRFFERNWQSLVTAFAAILAACGGLAALVTATSQTVDLMNHVGQQKELLDYQQKETAAEKAAVEASEARMDAEQKHVAAAQALDDANAKLAAAKAQLEQAQTQFNQVSGQLHSDRFTVFPDWLKKRQAERDDELKQIAALQQQIAKLPGNVAIKTQLTQLAQAVQGANKSGARRGLVYMQYSDVSSLTAMKGLQTTLSEDGYNVPGIEKVSPSLLNPAAKNEVRYFKPSDRGRAVEVAGIANTYLKTACPSHGAIMPRLHYVDSSSPNAPLELWAGFGCPAPKS